MVKLHRIFRQIYTILDKHLEITMKLQAANSECFLKYVCMHTLRQFLAISSLSLSLSLEFVALRLSEVF